MSVEWLRVRSAQFCLGRHYRPPNIASCTTRLAPETGRMRLETRAGLELIEAGDLYLAGAARPGAGP